MQTVPKFILKCNKLSQYLTWMKAKSSRRSNSLTAIQRISAGIATGFGTGLIPWAPGTWGSLWGVATAVFFPLNSFQNVGLFASLLVVGSYAAGRYSKLDDDPRIIVDEILGCWIACGLQTTWIGLLSGFILFRVLDIWKPGAISMLDRWSKKQSALWRKGFGIVVDDLLAGCIVLACLQLFKL